MGTGYESDKDREYDDKDFEEFLAENGELAEEPHREKPTLPRTSRRLVSRLGESSVTINPQPDRGDSESLVSESLDSEPLASDPLASDPLASDLLASDPLLSGRIGNNRVNSDLVDSESVDDDAFRGDSRGRIVGRMAWSTKQKLVVAFQGEAGAYSEQALRNYFGNDVVSLPRTDFRGIFDAIHSGTAQRGILPVENSLAGTVSAAYDQLADHDLRIQGEVILRVEHCLMAPAGLKLRDIKRVKSHPQALAQCRHTLRRMGLEPVVHYDTAGAARDLAKLPEPATAAIASALAAKTYGLEILSRHLEDEPLNYTRFFILGLSDPPRKDPSKTSIIFTTRHMPGALHRVLSELAQRDINLTKIESRPRRNRPWHYLFYVDFEGHEDQKEVREALLGILKQASFLKVLGSYPAAPLPLIEQVADPQD